MPKLITLLTQSMQQLHTQIWVSREQFTQKHPEALHHLRVSLRQLRSLLRPLRNHLNEAKELDQFVKKNMALTTLIRDREVLIIELKRCQMQELAHTYQQALDADYLLMMQQLELDAITQRLIALPRHWQHSLTERNTQYLEQHIQQQWQKHNQKLLKLIQQKTTDKHHLRILIKQLRYSTETYQNILPKHAIKQVDQLKSLQALLGTWHDYFVWLASAEQHTELASLIPHWQEKMQYWEHQVDRALKSMG
jgi:CHAD domain-containing protein